MATQDPIFICGSQRSGTSMTAAVFHANGAFGGRMRSTFNLDRCPFESMVVSDLLNKQCSHIGIDPSVHGQLPKEVVDFNLSWLTGWLTREFSYQGLKEQVWFVKNSKLLFFWRMWNNAFPNARWILVRRDPKEVATACVRTYTMTGRTQYEEWLEWAEWYGRQMDEVKSVVGRSFEVWPEKMFKRDFKEIRTAVESCGLEWNQLVVDQLLDSKTHKRERTRL